MYIFKDLHFHIQFIKFKKILCTKSHVYRVDKSLFLWLYHHTDTLKTIILQTLRFFFFFTLHIQSWHPCTIPLFLKRELQRKYNVIMQTFLIEENETKCAIRSTFINSIVT